MRPDQSPYRRGWWGISLEEAGLGHVRPRLGTYGLYDYDRLPPLPVPLTGDFAWLADAAIQPEWAIGAEGDHAKVAEQSSRLLKAEPRLPAPFATFLKTPSLHDRIRSHTACFLDICPCAVAAPAAPGRLVRFLCDQQCCGTWYVHLAPDGDHAVVMSTTYYGTADEMFEQPQEQETIFVAESFEAFLCRYWLENEIAFSTDHEANMPAAARDYVAAYR